MSFWKNLFGGSKAEEPGVERALAEEAYKGFTVKAIDSKIGMEFQLTGLIEKEIDGELRSYRFVRADRVADRDQLIVLALGKGRQIVDEQGEKIFS